MSETTTKVAAADGTVDSGEIDVAELNAALPSRAKRALVQQNSRLVRYLARPHWWLEIIVLGVLYAVYSMIRNSVGEVRTEAFRNAVDILSIEDDWHLAWERPLNDLVHTTGWLANIVAVQYASLHFIVTPAVLIWLMFRRKDVYRRVSSVLILTTGLALIGFYFWPTAPPRMLDGRAAVTGVQVVNEGFVDVMVQTSSWGWWPDSGAPGSDAVSNQFAAMPSLHCAWATWCGLALYFYARRRWVKILGLIYPFTTYFVVMGSGNHYLLDVIAGLATLAVGAAIIYGPRMIRKRVVRGRDEAGGQREPATASAE